MSQFKFFHGDWLDCSILFSDKPRELDEFPINLDIDFFNQLSFDETSLKQYRTEAAQHVAESIGSKIALSFSGGIDSQCMVQCFVEAKIDFDIFILRFKNNLNAQDVDHALLYCDKNNLSYTIIDIDVLNFLSMFNYEYAMKYLSASPHFNVHYKLFDLIRKEGYDGVVAGGNTPLYTTFLNSWGMNYNKNSQNYINYTNISGFKCQGNFLSFYPKLTWAISLMTEPVIDYIPSRSNLSMKERQYWEDYRYLQKVKGYQRAGFNIIPQSQKYTGFELVKKHLEEKTGDGWTFEKLYRHPIEKLLITKPTGRTRFLFKNKEIEDKVNSIYQDNFLTSGGAPSGI